MNPFDKPKKLKPWAGRRGCLNPSNRSDILKNLTILYFGTYEEAYSRNQILIKSLKKMGHTVKECHVSLWGNKIDKSGLLGGGLQTIIFFCRLLTIYPRLFFKYLFIGRYDILFVGYFGHLDMFFAKFFQFFTFRKKKIVFDAFISLYDSIVSDRNMVKADSFLAKILFWTDKTSCSLADLILLDTNAHIDFFQETFHIPKNKMVRIFASADTSIFVPRREYPKKNDDKFQILFMGKYTPLHGIEYIVEAAELLKNDEDIKFVFIGKGQLLPKIQALVEKKHIENIEFIDWVKYEKLPAYIESADVCLGIFADSAKASRVIPNKVFQSLAMGKAVITGNTKGAAEALQNGKNAILCNPADPQDLAAAILRLKTDPALRQKIAADAKQTFEKKLSDKTVMKGLRQIFK